MKPSREWIVQEIQRLATEDGVAPGQNSFGLRTGIKPWEWRGVYWTTWTDALAEADLSPQNWTVRSDDSEIFAALAAVVRQVGRFPTRAQLMLRRREDPTFPSETTIRRRGNVSQLVELTKRFCERDAESWSDVIDILVEAESRFTPPEQVEPRAPAGVAGYVYLVRSGKNFKIGMTRDVVRRLGQLNTGMAEAGELVHAISTDDPAGIERYWHTRFADRRLRPDAEWFALTAEDIKAFKRRAFQ